MAGKKIPFKFEFSAGGIVIKKEKNKIFVLLTQHSQHKGWSFPKGLIEKGEGKEETALREVLEEGGVEAKVIKEAGTTEYFYFLEGTRIKKKVYYFLMEYVTGKIKDHDWEMMDAKWVEKDSVVDRLTYKGDQEIFKKVMGELT